MLGTYGENPVLYRVQAENDPSGRTRNLYCNMLQPCDDLLDNSNWNLLKKDKKKRGSTVKNKNQNVERHKELQEENSEDELPQFTPIDETRLSENIKQATTKDGIPN